MGTNPSSSLNVNVLCFLWISVYFSLLCWYETISEPEKYYLKQETQKREQNLSNI